MAIARQWYCYDIAIMTMLLLPLLLVLRSTIFQQLCCVCLRVVLACVDYLQACAWRQAPRKKACYFDPCSGLKPWKSTPSVHAELKFAMPTAVGKCSCTQNLQIELDCRSPTSCHGFLAMLSRRLANAEQPLCTHQH